VAVALECRRRGLKPIVVSDDIGGIREPLETRGFALLSTRKFAQLLRSSGGRPPERRGEALSESSRLNLENEFLARDAESRRIRDLERRNRPAAAPVSRGASVKAAAIPQPPDRQKPAAGAGPAPAPRKPATEVQGHPRAVPDSDARRARGLRKQARRLALLQSRRKK
jgi:hypothetical protein